MSGATGPREAARALRGLIESEADACDRALSLTPALVDAFASARLFQIMVPRELGGLEADSDTLLDVFEELSRDGTLETLERFGAVITTPGCGACCGTSGVIPTDGMTVVSTANRNFKARMGNATAAIYLASPASCGAAAVTGMLTGRRVRV